MSAWNYAFVPEAQQDMRSLDGSQRKLVYKALQKLMINPLPRAEGGYGQPLGNRDRSRRARFLKIKLRDTGLRIVYDLVRDERRAYVIIVGVREDSKVYEQAERRLASYAAWLEDRGGAGQAPPSRPLDPSP